MSLKGIMKMLSVRLDDAEFSALSRLSEQLGETRSQIVKRSIAEPSRARRIRRVARTITEALTGLDDGKTYNFQFVFLNAGGSEGPKTANAKTNTVPRALDDTEAISKLASVEIDVLANDSDADADTLLRAVDADGGAEVFAARVVLKARFANVETVTFYSKGEYVSMNCRIPVK